MNCRKGTKTQDNKLSWLIRDKSRDSTKDNKNRRNFRKCLIKLRIESKSFQKCLRIISSNRFNSMKI